MSGAIKTKLKPKSSRKPVLLASLHPHDVTVETRLARGPAPWGQLLEDKIQHDGRLLPERAETGGGGGQAKRLFWKPSQMHWRPPRKGSVPKLKFHSTKQTPSGGRVSTVLGCLVHYVQNYLFGATPLSLKKSLSCDKQSL